MMKRYSKRIFLFFIFSFILSAAHAQVSLNQTNVAFLKENGAILAQRMNANRQKAYALAKEKGWDTFRIYKDGTVISLQGVDGLGMPIYYITYNNTIAAATTKTDRLYNGGGLGLSLSGSTVPNGKIAIWDGGAVLINHVEFATNRVEIKDGTSATSEHSTHVAGTMMAKGVNAVARGMAFGLPKLYSFDFNNDISEMSTNAATLLISNHSYGSIAGWRLNTSPARWEFWGKAGSTEDFKFGYYSSESQLWDLICYNAPFYLPVKSAGNNRGETGPAVGDPYFRFDANNNMVSAGARPVNLSSNNGYDIISTYGTAKNILTVGAINPLPFGAINPSSIQIASFSSWGPTDDGRIKPDLVADGVNLTSTSDSGVENYTTLSGTSMATPNVSGSLVLLQELYSQKNAGAFMRSATLKALVLGTATEAGSTPGPDYIYGWGLLNIEDAAKAILANGTKSMIAERSLTQGATDVISVIASGNGPLIATICWTDPEATAISEAIALNNPISRLINDLDMKAVQGATTYRPWILNPATPAAAATTGDNTRDNVEQIYIANAVPGKSYSLSITHKGTLVRGPQAYSIVITGSGGATYCASAPNSNADSKITNFKLANIDYTPATACTTYNDFTDQTIQLEKGKTYPLNVSLGTCGANFDKIAKVFVDWNSDGDFDDANELVATSTVINATGILSANITVPTTVTPDNYTLLRVVLTETTTAANITACGTYAKGETEDYRVKFLNSGIDLGVKTVVGPLTNACVNTAQAVTVTLKNFGAQDLANIPVTVTVTESGNPVATLTGTYTGTLLAGTEADFTLAGSFSAQSAKTYVITAKTTFTGDLNATNDQASGSALITVPPVPAATSTAYFCNSFNAYALSSSGTGTIFWYKNINDAIPFAYGNNVTTTDAPINNIYYAGINDYKSDVGPKTKNETYLGTGTYIQTTGTVTVNTLVPMTIESARLYIGNSGIIHFSVLNSSGVALSTNTLYVTATRANPGPGTLANDPTDQGQVYTLNLDLPKAGTYTIAISYENGATIFRNNGGSSGIPYPFNAAASLFSITGNNASPSTSFFYYFYDMKIKALGCTGGSRLAVPITSPIVTQNGTLLSSSIADNNQWYFNGAKIAGATTKDYTPLQTGKYFVEVTLASGCTIRSAEFNFTLPPPPVTDSPINLTIYPVPSVSDATISFDVADENSVSLKITNALGQTVYQESKANYVGRYKTIINTTKMGDGTYVVNVLIGNKVYGKKIVVSH